MLQLKNVSRLHGKNPGWQVTLKRSGVLHRQAFLDQDHGNKENALLRALQTKVALEKDFPRANAADRTNPWRIYQSKRSDRPSSPYYVMWQVPGSSRQYKGFRREYDAMLFANQLWTKSLRQ